MRYNLVFELGKISAKKADFLEKANEFDVNYADISKLDFTISSFLLPLISFHHLYSRVSTTFKSVSIFTGNSAF